jgi:hypothetical protein
MMDGNPYQLKIDELNATVTRLRDQLAVMTRAASDEAYYRALAEEELARKDALIRQLRGG